MDKGEIISRYLSGDTTEYQQTKAIELLESFEQESIADCERYWNKLTCTDLQLEVPFDRIQQEITKELFHQRKSRSSSIQYLAVAASILLVIFFYSLFLLSPFTSESGNITAKKGEVVMEILPDGTNVMLNGGSTLTYEIDKSGIRETWLSGEAFFDVTEANGESNRFIIHAGNAEITVLGTRLNVNNFSDQTAVVLESGKVTFQHRQMEQKVSMNAGEMIRLKGNEQFIHRHVETKKFTSWVNGKLIFDRTPVRDILETMESVYGYTVDYVQPDLKDRLFTGAGDTNNLPSFLEILARTFEVPVEIEGKKIILGNKI